MLFFLKIALEVLQEINDRDSDLVSVFMLFLCVVLPVLRYPRARRMQT